VSAGHSTATFYGWRVVAAVFVLAIFGWGLGFYGLTATNFGASAKPCSNILAIPSTCPRKRNWSGFDERGIGMTPEFLSEQEVLKRWPMLTRGELRKARRANPPKIGFYAFAKKNGGPCYTVEQVQAYIDATYLRSSLQCRAETQTANALNSADTTSKTRTRSVADIDTPAGMTPELAKSAAGVLVQRILNRPRSNSRHSSLPRRSAQRSERPALTG
jgi:hypothetical protein